MFISRRQVVVWTIKLAWSALPTRLTTRRCASSSGITCTGQEWEPWMCIEWWRESGADLCGASEVRGVRRGITCMGQEWEPWMCIEWCWESGADLCGASEVRRVIMYAFFNVFDYENQEWPRVLDQKISVEGDLFWHNPNRGVSRGLDVKAGHPWLISSDLEREVILDSFSRWILTRKRIC